MTEFKCELRSKGNFFSALSHFAREIITIGISAMIISACGSTISNLNASNPTELTHSHNPLPTGEFYTLVDAVQSQKHQYYTIGHKILDIESETGAVTPQMYERLDSIIARASKKLEKMPLTTQDEGEAKDILSEIDKILTEENFVYPSSDLVGTLAEALTPVELDGDNLLAVKETSKTAYREQYIEHRGAGVYYFADCDTLSFIFLSIADVLKLPLRIVEVVQKSNGKPFHNNVRWEFANGKYVDWDTVYGHESFKDSSFINYVLSDGEFSGYIQGLISEFWNCSWNSRRVLAVVRKSFAHGYRRAYLLNELAWILSTDPDPAVRNPAEAKLYADELYSGNTYKHYSWEPTDDQIDTCAAVAARCGDFDRAVRLQEEAIRKSTDDAVKIQKCKRLCLYIREKPYTQARWREERAKK